MKTHLAFAITFAAATITFVVAINAATKWALEDY